MKGYFLKISSLLFILGTVLSCVSPVSNGSDITNDGIVQGDIRDISSETGLNNDAGQSLNANFPDAEVLIKILSPSGSEYADSMGGTISVAGLVFGRVENMYLIAPDGQKHALSGSPYWESDAINLSPGDNTIEVHAEGNNQTAMDRIVVTYNPGIKFGGRLKVLPPAIFTGEKVGVHAFIQAPASSLVDLSTIKLVKCDATGKPVQDEGRMLDDGIAQVSGDEIQGDGVYTLQFNATCKTAGVQYYRVAMKVRAIGGQAAYTAFSEPAQVECVGHLDPLVCQQHQNILKGAQKAYEDARAKGRSPATAKAAAYGVMDNATGVAEHGSADSPFGLWVRFDDNILGAINTPEPGIRGGGEPDNHAGIISALKMGKRILSSRVLVWSPMSSELADSGNVDEGKALADMVKNRQCPAFDLNGPWTNGAAKLKFMRELTNYGVIVLVTHGDALFHGMSESGYDWFHKGSQEVLWSGQQVDCKHMLSHMTACTGNGDCPLGSKCLTTSVTIEGKNRLVTKKHGICYDASQVDLMQGRAVMGPKNYAVTPEFIAHYGQGGHARSLVYLGACRSMYNGTLAAAFMASGAQTVLGYNGYVTSKFASSTGLKFFQSMMESQERVGMAASQGAIDPIYHSRLMMFGSHWLDLNDYSILNGNFEAPGMLGWDTSGDARVIPKLGHTGPLEGKRMAIISTGLGFTTESGGISQKFCIPPGATRIKFYWKFYSEEFKEFCNSTYQDTFQATISSPMANDTDIVSVNINSLCPEGIVPCNQSGGSSSNCKACTECGSYWGDDRDHLIKSDVRFDKGGVWNTPWQMTTFDLKGKVFSFSNQSRPVPVTLKFIADDTGDSIYDTAILIDSIEIE